MTQRVKRPSGRGWGQVEVVGIVHPLGPGGGRGGNEELWTLRFSFVEWRREDGGVDERELRLQQPRLSDAGLRRMMESIKPYDILRVRLRFTDTPDGASALQAELAEVLGKDSTDDELKARVERLREPVTVDHPFFGTFTLNRALNWYEVTFPWNSKPIHLTLSRDGCEDENELFGTALSLWKQQKKWDRRIRDYAVEKLLGLKNDVWLGDDEAELTPSGFKAQITLESIAVYPGGRFEFTFGDGDLFLGHIIQVRGTLQEGPTDAGIAG